MELTALQYFQSSWITEGNKQKRKHQKHYVRTESQNIFDDKQDFLTSLPLGLKTAVKEIQYTKLQR